MRSVYSIITPLVLQIWEIPSSLRTRRRKPHRDLIGIRETQNTSRKMIIPRTAYERSTTDLRSNSILEESPVVSEESVHQCPEEELPANLRVNPQTKAGLLLGESVMWTFPSVAYTSI